MPNRRVLVAALVSFTVAAAGAAPTKALVAAGQTHSLTLSTDGTVRAWGSGATRTPTTVRGLSGIVALAAGFDQSLAVKDDGTVWTFAMPADGAKAADLTAQQMGELSGAVSAAAGGSFAMALKHDGTVWTWGGNQFGELAAGGSGGVRIYPGPTTGLANVVAIAAGYVHGLAVKNDGTVWSWGHNGYGQLGDGTALTNPLACSRGPEQVHGISGATAVAAGYSHSLALTSDGTVWAWGSNGSGELGDGTNSDRPEPVQVARLANVVAIAAGTRFSMALKNDGTVWAWGSNEYGKLGIGTDTNVSVPTQSIGLGGVTAIAAGATHALAAQGDGSVWAWGAATAGQLGNGTPAASSEEPVQVYGLKDMVAIATTGEYSLAVKADGTVWGWGANGSGQLGDGTTITRFAPVQATGMTDAIAVSASDSHSVALRRDGTVWEWGSQQQIGQFRTDVSQFVRATPVQVPDLRDIAAISVFGDHNLALGRDGTVWKWLGWVAREYYYDTDTKPVQVSGLTGAVAVAAGMDPLGIERPGLALKSDGTLWEFADEWPAAQLTDIAGIAGIGGGWCSVAVKDDGTVWMWGWGWVHGRREFIEHLYGPQELRPEKGLTNITAVSTGSGLLALRRDGTVWDDGGVDPAAPPEEVAGLTGVVAIAGGGFGQGLALKSDGTVWAWGDNSFGQLGNGSAARSTPTQVIPPDSSYRRIIGDGRRSGHR